MHARKETVRCTQCHLFAYCSGPDRGDPKEKTTRCILFPAAGGAIMVMEGASCSALHLHPATDARHSRGQPELHATGRSQMMQPGSQMMLCCGAEAWHASQTPAVSVCLAAAAAGVLSCSRPDLQQRPVCYRALRRRRSQATTKSWHGMAWHACSRQYSTVVGDRQSGRQHAPYLPVLELPLVSASLCHDATHRAIEYAQYEYEYPCPPRKTWQIASSVRAFPLHHACMHTASFQISQKLRQSQP